MGIVKSDLSAPCRATLEEEAWSGDERSLAELFSILSPRLRRIVDSRLDRRLAARIDASDVLQDAYIELARKMPNLREQFVVGERPRISLLLLMQLVTTERVIVAHRRHLEAEGRDVRRESRRATVNASSMRLAEQLLVVFGSADNRILQQEMFDTLRRALASMDAVDREIIAMRCFEELTNKEAAEVLGISANGASSRFVRAITRLKKQLESIPGFAD